MDTVKLANKGNTKMIAHRGVSKLERENTMPAFVAAGNRSYHGIETDIHVTQDGRFIVHHDSNTLRLTNVDCIIEEQTFDYLRSLPIMDFDEQPRVDLHMPSLEEYIKTCKKYGKVAVLELKNAMTREQVYAVCDVLDALEYLTTDTPMNIDGATQDVAGMIRLKRPTGIENSVPYDVSVTAKIREKEIERTFRSVNVEVMGVEDAMNAVLEKKQLTVQIGGGYGFVSGLAKDAIRLYVDAAGLAPGKHTLPVQIDIDNAPEFSCALSAPELEVTISEKR